MIVAGFKSNPSNPLRQIMLNPLLDPLSEIV